MRPLRIFLLLLPCLLLAACSTQADEAGSAPPPPPPRLKLVATIPPVGALVSAVAGPAADVQVLLPAGSSPHSWEPTPSVARALREADHVFHVDPAFDGWTGGLAGGKVTALGPLVPAELQQAFPGTCTGHGHDHHHHDHGHMDPHFWTDPMVMAALAPAVAQALGQVDSPNAAVYTQNAQRVVASLEELDGELGEILGPVRGQPVILFHASMNYMLARYGLEYAGAIEVAPGRAPTPGQMREILDRIESDGIRALFIEPQLAPTAAEAIAESAGLDVYTLDPLGGEGSLEGYRSMMLQNAGTLAEALGP